MSSTNTKIGCIVSVMIFLSRRNTENGSYISNMAIAGRPSKIKKSEYGSRLYESRCRAGLSQNEVAQALGVTQQYVAAWERKGKTLRLELLVKLSSLYTTSVDMLVGATEPKNSINPIGRLKKSFDRASKLSRRQQEKIAEFVDAFSAAHEKK